MDMPNTERAFELLDDNRWDDREDYDTYAEDREERRRVAAILRYLRIQPRCSVSSDLMREWQRKAGVMQCWRRAEWQQPKAGL